MTTPPWIPRSLYALSTLILSRGDVHVTLMTLGLRLIACLTLRTDLVVKTVDTRRLKLNDRLVLTDVVYLPLNDSVCVLFMIDSTWNEENGTSPTQCAQLAWCRAITCSRFTMSDEAMKVISCFGWQTGNSTRVNQRSLLCYGFYIICGHHDRVRVHRSLGRQVKVCQSWLQLQKRCVWL